MKSARDITNCYSIRLSNDEVVTSQVRIKGFHNFFLMSFKGFKDRSRVIVCGMCTLFQTMVRSPQTKHAAK